MADLINCYKSCESNYGALLQEKRNEIKNYEESHTTSRYTHEDLQRYNTLHKDFDNISTHYNSCRANCRKQNTGGRTRSTIRRRNKSKTKRRQTRSTRRRNTRRRRSTRRNRKQ